MDRISIAVALATFLFLCAGVPVSAQEATKPAPAVAPAAKAGEGVAEDQAPAEEPAEESVLAPVTGEKVWVRIRPGVELSGIVRERHYEVFKNNRYVRAASPEEQGAGLRVFYVTGLNGFLFIRADSIIDVEFSGALTREEGLSIAKRLAEEEKRAEEEKARAAEEMQQRRLAARAAAEGRTEGDGGKAPGAGAGKATGGASDKALKLRELLVRFPPKDWTPARLDEIKRRAIILDIFPNEEESAFIENYDLWLEGYEMWKKENAGK